MAFQLRSILRAINCALAGSLACLSYAQATSCWVPSPDEHINQADIIFYGEAKEGADGPNDNKQRTVKFNVIRAYKGVSGQSIDISYYNDAGALIGWGFENERATLVFASGQTATRGAVIGQVDYCSMIPYHARPHLHAGYWDILVPMQPEKSQP